MHRSRIKMRRLTPSTRLLKLTTSCLRHFVRMQRRRARRVLRLSAVDTARARVRRERESPRKLSAVQAEVARGEMAIALGVFGGKNGSKDGIPVEWLKEWIRDERLPQGWKYTHTQGMCQSVRASTDIRNAMKAITESYEKGGIGRWYWRCRHRIAQHIVQLEQLVRQGDA